MRITNKMLANNFLNDMNVNLQNLQTLQQQMTSGKEIRKPSDNPFKVSRSMQLHSEINANTQYNSNIKDTINWLDTTDTALGQAGDILQRIRELLVSAGDAAYGSSERAAINDEINERVSEFAQVMNTNFDGKYIFGGTRGTVKPMDTTLGEFYANSVETRSLSLSGSEPIPSNSEITISLKINNSEKNESDLKDDLQKQINSKSYSLKINNSAKNASDLADDLQKQINKIPDLQNKIYVSSKDGKLEFINKANNEITLGFKPGKTGETGKTGKTGETGNIMSFNNKSTINLSNDSPFACTNVLNLSGEKPITDLSLNFAIVDKKTNANSKITFNKGENKWNISKDDATVGITVGINNEDNKWSISKDDATEEIKDGINNISDLANAVNKKIEKSPDLKDKIKVIPDYANNSLRFINVDSNKDDKIYVSSDVIDNSDKGIQILYSPNNENNEIFYYNEGGGVLLDGPQLNQINQNLDVEISQGVVFAYNVNACQVVQFKNQEGQQKDLRQILKNVVSDLSSAGKGDLDAKNVKKILSGDLQDITDTINNILKLRAEVGAKENSMDAAKNKNVDQNFNMTKILSKTEDIDLTQKTMQFAIAQTVYMASLQTSARVLQPTLLDYLR